MITYRCSSLPLIIACPASTVCDGGPLLASEGPEARLGSAVHEVLAKWIGGVRAYDDPEKAARKWDVDPEDAFRLVHAGWHCWEQLAPLFPQPVIEVPLVGGMLTGHADVLSLAEGTVRVLDWKSGYRATDYTAQLTGYAWLVLQQCPEAEHASVATVWLREQAADWKHYERSDLDSWYSRLLDQLAAANHGYNPGPHCDYCPRSLTCPAHAAQLRRDANALLVADEAGEELVLPDLTGPEYIALIERCRLLEGLCLNVRHGVKARVVAAGGRLLTGDGRELVLATQERRSIAFTDGWDVLAAEGLATPEVREAMTIPKEAVERAAMARAPRGQKGAAAKEIMARLEAAGAVRTTAIERLEVRRGNSSDADQKQRDSGANASSEPGYGVYPAGGEGPD